MKHSTFSLSTHDNLKLFGQSWLTDAPAQAVVCLVHGMGEHSTRYTHVADYLTRNGIAVVTFDHRGHGKSDGKKGHAPDYEALMKDVDLLLKQASSLVPNVPVFLFGHSMGGNVVLNYALRRNPNIKGVIASAPWLHLAFEPSKLDLFLANTMIKIYPSFTQPTKLDATAISRDVNEVKKYKEDPLVHDLISPAMFLGTKNAADWALANADKWKLPLLIYHGTSDKLTGYTGSKEFAQKAKGDITWKSLQGFFHESHNEPEKEVILEMILGWIKERI